MHFSIYFIPRSECKHDAVIGILSFPEANANMMQLLELFHSLKLFVSFPEAMNIDMDKMVIFKNTYTHQHILAGHPVLRGYWSQKRFLKDLVNWFNNAAYED
ncbi:hypothetical protein GQ457_01G037510 [Hibiscus cannabinus]